MIVRITRVKVGQRQAPITAPCSNATGGFVFLARLTNLLRFVSRTSRGFIPITPFFASFSPHAWQTHADNTAIQMNSKPFLPVWRIVWHNVQLVLPRTAQACP